MFLELVIPGDGQKRKPGEDWWMVEGVGLEEHPPSHPPKHPYVSAS